MSVDELIGLAAALSVEERRFLAQRILATLRAEKFPTVTPGRRWEEIRGSASEPMVGEDAQAWISQGRQEADAHRQTP